MIKTSSKPPTCSVPMTNGNFPINMACQLMSLPSRGKNMALGVEVGSTSSKLLCPVGISIISPHLGTKCSKQHQF